MKSTNSNKSDVERFWEAMACKMDVKQEWHDLNPMEQHQVIQGINMILGVVANLPQD